MHDLARGADLRKRTKQLALRVIRLCDKMPARPVARIIANQLLRTGTSVGANYRAVCRARNRQRALETFLILTFLNA
ncbi:MAG: four helix bundle protein [Acidobacteriia bacterium]|nr:four helix bundle protein [Terriglobia bacterium]